jgi:hypothetical protein
VQKLYDTHSWTLYKARLSFAECSWQEPWCWLETRWGLDRWRALGPGLKRRIASRWWHGDVAEPSPWDGFPVFLEFLREKGDSVSSRFARPRLRFAVSHDTGWLNASWDVWEHGRGDRMVHLWNFTPEDEAAFVTGDPKDAAWEDAPVPD